MLERLNVAHPRARVIDHPAEAVEAAEGLAYRVLVKPNIGGSEYLVDTKTGQPHLYDIDALSNFVADAPNVAGFDPFVNLVDFIAARTAVLENVRV